MLFSGAAKSERARGFLCDCCALISVCPAALVRRVFYMAQQF